MERVTGWQRLVAELVEITRPSPRHVKPDDGVVEAQSFQEEPLVWDIEMPGMGDEIPPPTYEPPQLLPDTFLPSRFVDPSLSLNTTQPMASWLRSYE